MHILNKIIHYKQEELAQRKLLQSESLLEQSIFFDTQPVSMVSYLRREEGSGIIAEIKRASPSTGVLQEDIDVERLSISYMQAGAAALSVLTDQHFFAGQSEDLRIARKFNYCPILRKDFIIDPYQVIETKSIGADCILLIAACLTPTQVLELARLAKELRLEVLLELHDKEDIGQYVNDYIDIVGVNNRNLKDFSCSIQHSIDMKACLPTDRCLISESGISNAEQILKLRSYGFEGFLIGGHFMRQTDPAQACKQFVETIKNEGCYS